MPGATRAVGGKRTGPTIYELNATGEGRSVREIPRLVAAGLGRSMAGSIGAAAALLTVAPLLVPVLTISGLSGITSVSGPGI